MISKVVYGLMLINSKENEKMNYKKYTLVLLILFMLLISSAKAGVDHRLKFDIGYPAGYMDLMAGFSYELILEIPYVIHPQFIVYNHFLLNTNNENDVGFGMSMTSIYLMGRRPIKIIENRLDSYIAAGFGSHFIYSISDEESPLENKFTITSKGHVLFGLNLYLSEHWYFRSEGRVTYPSDIIWDSGCIGIGIRF